MIRLLASVNQDMDIVEENAKKLNQVNHFEKQKSFTKNLTKSLENIFFRSLSGKF